MSDTEGVAEQDALLVMRERVRQGTKWAVYTNEAMDSRSLGHSIFLMVGEGCTHATPPTRAPDGSYGLGWKYLFKGFLNLDTNQVERGGT